jgi:hypothetical protein
MTSPISRYLCTRAITAPWRIEGNSRTDFAGAVVIPALAESENLFATLDSLASNPAEHLALFLVVVVVNHREDAVSEDKTDNRLTLERLGHYAAASSLALSWINAAAPGLELPVKGGGVGLARKIGFDLALTRLDYRKDPLLLSLDADTLVQSDYLPVVSAQFRSTGAGGAVIPFRHREEGPAEQQAAIRRYELFLRHYVLGLRLAQSPYAFHTVGSAMACRAIDYARAGGMNRRTAGEDFYFLQQLAKTSGIVALRGTTVHPSPRPSARVPFGTGRSVARQMAGEKSAVMFYRPECFRILGAWLAKVMEKWRNSAPELLEEAEAICPGLSDFLTGADFARTWAQLQRNHRSKEAFSRAFHGWFDALRTLRFIHFLSAHFPRCTPAESIPILFQEADIPLRKEEAAWLKMLRDEDGVGPAADKSFFQQEQVLACRSRML